MLGRLTFAQDAKASVAQAADYVTSLDKAQSVASSAGGFLGSALALDLVDEAKAEQLLLSHVGASSQRDGFDPLVRAAVARAQAMLDRFGFSAPPVARKNGEQITVDIEGADLNVWAQYFRYVDLRPMRRWATDKTRRAALSAAQKLLSSFWCCTFADYLYQNASIYGELFTVVQAAVAAKKPDFESLWKEAREHMADAGMEDGDLGEEVYGIGGREEFKRWIAMQVSVVRARSDFKAAPASGRINRHRSNAVRTWARRVERLCATWGAWSDQGCEIEQGENRNLDEQAIVLCGGQDKDAINWYFEVTDDGNGEMPGVQVKLDPTTGSGLIEGLVLALVGQCVFDDLRRAMR